MKQPDVKHLISPQNPAQMYAYLMGKFAFTIEKPKTHNPFFAAATKHFWLKGWMDAKRSQN